jgi:hypothetical protein
MMMDGAWETISGKNLELDVEYRDSILYPVVRTRE